MTDWQTIQQWAGVQADGVPGPATARAIIVNAGLDAPPRFNRAEFLARYVNTSAPAISLADRVEAANRIGHGATVKHILALEAVESGGASFDNSGRPIILPEPHIFYRLTGGRYGQTSFSSKAWNRALYPKSYDGRWQMLADMAERDELAALQSASWGMFQVMGFNFAAAGFASPQAFAAAMAEDEDNHLEAMVNFIISEGLADELADCSANDPASCRPFVSRYNGPGYRANKYDEKFAAALR